MTSKSKCICDFDTECSGTGVRYCRGCGGDLCVCLCGGELPCDVAGGCDQCDFDDCDTLDDGFEGLDYGEDNA